MKDRFITFSIFMVIILAGIMGLKEALNKFYINAAVYLVITVLIVLIYLISIIATKIDIYHKETQLLREDLAKLNKELSRAFDKVDSNFTSLVMALDDFVLDMENKE